MAALRETLGVSKEVLWKATSFETNGRRAKQLRAAALQRGGVLYTGLVPESFLASVETTFDHQNKKIVQQIRAFTRDQHMEFMAQHGKRLSKMVALTICRGYLSGWLLTPLVAFAVRWCVTPERILGAHLEYVSLLGANPFLPIIRSAELMNPLTPRLSHDKKRS